MVVTPWTHTCAMNVTPLHRELQRENGLHLPVIVYTQRGGWEPFKTVYSLLWRFQGKLLWGINTVEFRVNGTVGGNEICTVYRTARYIEQHGISNSTVYRTARYIEQHGISNSTVYPTARYIQQHGISNSKSYLHMVVPTHHYFCMILLNNNNNNNNSICVDKSTGGTWLQYLV